MMRSKGKVSQTGRKIYTNVFTENIGRRNQWNQRVISR